MNLEDARALWKSDDRHLNRKKMDATALEQIAEQSREFDRVIRRRDRRELLACGVVAPFFLPALFYPGLLTRAGAVVVIASCILIAVMLRRARRRHPDPPAAAPTALLLRAEREKVAAQMRLLKSVLWWYILPLACGVLMTFAGVYGMSLVTLVYAAGVAALSWGLFILNRHAVRSELQPWYEELNELVMKVEG